MSKKFEAWARKHGRSPEDWPETTTAPNTEKPPPLYVNEQAVVTGPPPEPNDPCGVGELIELLKQWAADGYQ